MLNEHLAGWPDGRFASVVISMTWIQVARVIPPAKPTLLLI
jgi:hypothetical protein